MKAVWEGALDDLGIARWTRGSMRWPGVPAGFAETVMTARDPALLIEHMLDGPEPWRAAQQRSVMHPASALGAALGPVQKGGTALDLGTGWFGLAPALASFGMETTRADWIYPRLRFARLLDRDLPVTDVLVDPLHLPAALAKARSYDVIFLDLAPFSGTAHHRLLASARRLLRPGGAIVARVIDQRARYVVARSPLRAAGTPSWRTVARSAKLAVRASYYAIEDGGGPRVVAPPSLLGEQIALHRRYRGHKRALLGVLRAAGGARLLAPDRILLLAPIGAATPASAVVRVLGEQEQPLLLPLSDARVGVLGRERFVKVALSVDQQQALISEADKTRRAGATPFAAHMVQPEDTRGHHDGMVWVTYPRVITRDVAAETTEAAIASVLDKLGTSTHATLEHTPLWRRLRSDRGQQDIADLAAEPLWKWVSSRCADVRVPVGPCHGDLHPGNVLMPADGADAILVDWNRFEEDDPLFLDPLYAAIGLEQSATRCSLAQAMGRAARGTLSGPLVVRAAELRGALGPAEAAVLLLLDRIASYSLPRRRYKPWTLATLEDTVRCLADLLPAVDQPRGAVTLP